MSAATPTPQTIQRLVSILRRDLKLGPDALLDESTPLLGGEHDLDSLDILLLLTAVEKEFGIKIPNEALQQQAFRNVATLAEFIERQPVSPHRESSQPETP
jgi:acyl carrier protein